MRVLYHFLHSVFSRRARLALAYKGIDVELRDGRADTAYIVQARRLTPVRTMPVFVDEERVVADSGAIAQYLDLAYPDRPLLFPRGADAARDALEVMTLVDVAMNALVDLGTRNWDLRNDPAWKDVAAERMDRAHAAMKAVAAKATKPFLAGGAWSAADIWTLSATLWVSGMPERVTTSPQVAQIMTLGFELPPALVDRSKQHRDRPDVKSVYG